MKHTPHPATATAAGDTTHPATSTDRKEPSPALVLECVPADESPELEDTTKDGTAVFLSPPPREGEQRPGVLARLSIVARILPECIARSGGRWFLSFQIENPTPTGPTAGTPANTFTAPIGEGCAISFDKAASLFFAE